MKHVYIIIFGPEVSSYSWAYNTIISVTILHGMTNTQTNLVLVAAGQSIKLCRNILGTSKLSKLTRTYNAIKNIVEREQKILYIFV